MTKSLTEIKSLARSYTEMAVQTLAGIAQNGQSEPAKVAACTALLDRGWGKPAQAIVGGDEDDPELKIIHKIERVIVDPKNPNG